MTDIKVSEDTLLVAKQFMFIAKQYCPHPPIRYATGRLQDSIQMRNVYYLNASAVEVRVGNSKTPYLPYTNEEWISPKWNGKKNPNEHWWDKSINQVVNLVIDQEKGVRIYG